MEANVVCQVLVPQGVKVATAKCPEGPTDQVLIRMCHLDTPPVSMESHHRLAPPPPPPRPPPNPQRAVSHPAHRGQIRHRARPGGVARSRIRAEGEAQGGAPWPRPHPPNSQLIVAMRSPSWTTSPSATCSLATVPAS